MNCHEVIDERNYLEHILRASKGLTGESEFIVIGSQAILGPHPDAPRELRESMEADLLRSHGFASFD